MKNEDDGALSPLHKFLYLAEAILAIWEGEDSLRRSIEGLIERQQAKKEKIRGAEEAQRKLAERLLALEQHAQEEKISLQQLRHERLQALAPGITPSSAPGAHKRGSASEEGSHFRSGKVAVPSIHRKGVHYSDSVLCAAFEMLELVHERLTSHMWAYMCGRVRDLQSAEERGAYLRIFRGVKGKSVFGTKALSEAAYAELLDFALLSRSGEGEVEAVLEAAEKRLAEEASMAGLGSIGNPREQMRPYLQQLRRHFTSRLPLFHFSGNAASPPLPSSSSHQRSAIPIPHVLSVARRGQLGALQHASQLIQFACLFFSSNLHPLRSAAAHSSCTWATKEQ